MASASRHYQNITVLRFVDDGSHLVSGGYDNLVIVWRVARCVCVCVCGVCVCVCVGVFVCV